MKKNKEIIGIYKYGTCNYYSLSCALDKIRIKYFISENLKDLTSFKKIIFPGVGSIKNFNSEEKKINRNILNKFILNGGYLYGICLGMQFFLGHSEESKSKNLNLLNGRTAAFLGKSKMNMNVGCREIFQEKKSKIFDLLIDKNKKKFYFLHKYYCDVEEPNIEKVYFNFLDKKYLAGYFKNNILGTQFHPELSGEYGLKFLYNFCKKL